MSFYVPNFFFFFENRQQFNARAGQKKNTCFFGNVRPKSNVRAHLQQRKKPGGLFTKKPLKIVQMEG